MLKKLEEMRSVAIDKINQAATQLELNECRAEYLGKKSPLNEIMKQMGSLTPEERKEFGQTANQFKNLIEQTINERRQYLEDMAVNAKLESEKVDVTLPGKDFSHGSLHIMTQTIREVEDIFIGMGYDIAEGPEVELGTFNISKLYKSTSTSGPSAILYPIPIKISSTSSIVFESG